MQITFVLPSIGISGGGKVVLEYANRLKKRGHKVRVIYPLVTMSSGRKWYNLRNLSSKALGILRNFKNGVHVDWFDLKARLIRVPTLYERYIPEGDIIVATWWETAYYVKKYNKDKGEKFYLIQHYETWGGPKEKVEATYKMGLHNIVVSSWLKNKLKNIGAKVEEVILNGVNLEEFFPEKIKKDKNVIRILMPYRKEKWKGVEDGIEAFKIVKEKYPNVKLVTFGEKPKKSEVFKEAEFHIWPTGENLRKIYNSCDIFVFPSHCEGFGLPPMEAMACKLPVVTTEVGAVPEYTIPGTTALVVPPQNPKELSQNIIKLIKNKELREKIAENGYNYIKQFTWDKSVEKLEGIFKKHGRWNL